jgi:hypothetical protein
VVTSGKKEGDMFPKRITRYLLSIGILLVVASFSHAAALPEGYDTRLKEDIDLVLDTIVANRWTLHAQAGDTRAISVVNQTPLLPDPASPIKGLTVQGYWLSDGSGGFVVAERHGGAAKLPVLQVEADLVAGTYTATGLPPQPRAFASCGFFAAVLSWFFPAPAEACPGGGSSLTYSHSITGQALVNGTLVVSAGAKIFYGITNGVLEIRQEGLRPCTIHEDPWLLVSCDNIPTSLSCGLNGCWVFQVFTGRFLHRVQNQADSRVELVGNVRGMTDTIWTSAFACDRTGPLAEVTTCMRELDQF